MGGVAKFIKSIFFVAADQLEEWSFEGNGVLRHLFRASFGPSIGPRSRKNKPNTTSTKPKSGARKTSPVRGRSASRGPSRSRGRSASRPTRNVPATSTSVPNPTLLKRYGYRLDGRIAKNEWETVSGTSNNVATGIYGVRYDMVRHPLYIRLRGQDITATLGNRGLGIFMSQDAHDHIDGKERVKLLSIIWHFEFFGIVKPELEVEIHYLILQRCDLDPDPKNVLTEDGIRAVVKLSENKRIKIFSDKMERTIEFKPPVEFSKDYEDVDLVNHYGIAFMIVVKGRPSTYDDKTIIFTVNTTYHLEYDYDPRKAATFKEDPELIAATAP